MIPKFIAKDGSVLEIDITKIPIETLLTIILNQSERRDEDGASQTTISLEALQIMETYASEGKLLIGSSVLDMANSGQSWCIDVKLVSEISIILITNPTEYSSVDLMRIVFEELWAVHNKNYVNVIDTYTEHELTEMRRKYIVAINNLNPSGVKWIDTVGEKRLQPPLSLLDRYINAINATGKKRSQLSLGDSGYKVAAYVNHTLPKDIPYRHFGRLMPADIKAYGRLIAKRYGDELYVVMASPKTNRETHDSLGILHNIENPITPAVNTTAVVFMDENASLDDILLNDNIPYIYRCSSIESRYEYRATTSWLFCTMRGVNVVNNQALASSELYNYMIYPIYVSEVIPIIHVHMYPDVSADIREPIVPVPDVEFGITRVVTRNVALANWRWTLTAYPN